MSNKLYDYGPIDEQYIKGDTLVVKVLTQLEQDIVKKYYDFIIVFRWEKIQNIYCVNCQIDLIKNYTKTVFGCSYQGVFRKVQQKRKCCF